MNGLLYDISEIPATAKRYDKARAISGQSNKNARQHLDFYPTPPHATAALLDHEEFIGEIWEPACGQGGMSKEIERHGYTVRSSDIADYGYGESGINFLATIRRDCPNIITNPPYSNAHAFSAHALSITSGKVAMLCKLVFLEGQSRKAWFQGSPLKAVYVFSKRLNFAAGKLTDAGNKSNGMMAFAWFVWEHGYEGEPVIRWI